MTSHENSPVFHAFHVQDGYWTKIGAAWETKSGQGFSVVLELLPPDGRFVLAKPRPRKAAATPPAPPRR
jgi:hypothetical protein